jgi:hypothetical protein
MTAFTTPRTWAVAEVLTSGNFNTYISGCLTELQNFALSMVTGVQAGSKAIAGTYTIVAPAAGTYVLLFGAGGVNTVSGGSTLKITSNLGGEVDYSDTGPSAGAGLVAGQILTNGQTITMTIGTIAGSGSATLLGCWALLLRDA